MGMRKIRWVVVLASALLLLMAGSIAATGFSFTEGSFNSIIYVNPAEPAFDVGLESMLMLDFQLENVGLRLMSIFRETGWEYQMFNISGTIGGANFAADVRFNPMTSALDSAELQGILLTYGVDLRATLIIEPGASGAITEITGWTTDASIACGSRMFFNADEYGNIIDPNCTMSFTGAELFVRAFGLPCCPDLSIDASMTFTTAGFEALEFEVDPLTFEMFPWITLSGSLRFELEEKILDLRVSPSISAWEDCFSMYIRFDYGVDMTTVEALEINSLTLECEIEGISFEAVSYPGSGQRARMRSRSIGSNLTESYWEWYRIWAEQDGCCGPFGFEVAFYFLDGGLRLFDLAAIQALFSVQLSSGFEFGSAMEFDLEVGSWVYWDFNFEVAF